MTLTTPQISQQGNNYYVSHGTDASLFVQFYMESVQDEEASVEAGRPIFNEKEFVKIIPVGDKNTVVCRPVDLVGKNGNLPDNERFPKQYQAFKNQQHQPQEGTPLEHYPPLTKSQVMMFKAANVHTVEQLANVSDHNLQNLGMGARQHRDEALAYIENAKNGAVPLKAQKEIDDLKKQIEALKNQLNGFKSVGAVEDEKPAKPAKRGRKKKDEIDD